MNKKLVLLMPLAALALALNGCSCSPSGEKSSSQTETTTEVTTTAEETTSKQSDASSEQTSDGDGSKTDDSDEGSKSDGDGSKSDTGGGSKSDDTQEGSKGTTEEEHSSEDEHTSEEEHRSEDTSTTEEETIPYAGLINGLVEMNFVKSGEDERGQDTWVEQYKATIDVEAGDVLTFFSSLGLQVFPGDGMGAYKNNVRYDQETHILTVVKTTVNANLYFKVYDGGYDVWLTGNEDAEPPVTDIYSAKLGDVALTLVDVSDTKGELDPWIEQYKVAGIEVKAGDALTFAKGDEAIFPTDGLLGHDEGNNVYYNDDTKALTVHNDATTDLYFKVFENGVYTVWLGGYEADEEEDVYKAYNGLEELTLVDATDEKLEGDTWTIQLKAANIDVEAGDILSFTLNDVQVFPGDGMGNIKNNVRYDEETHYLTVVKDAEDATLYFKVYADGYDVWLTGNEDAEPEEIAYSAKLGDTGLTLVDVSDTKGEGDTWLEQYKVEGLEVKAGDALTFASGDEAIFPTDGLLGHDAGNNVVFNDQDSSLKVINDATADLYFKVYDGGVYTVWLGGYVAPTSTYTITWTADVTVGDNALLAWTWGGGAGGGKWIGEVTPDGKSAAVVAPNDITGMILVLFPEGTTPATADWNNKIKQTSDINISSGTLTYSASWN